MTTYAYGAPVGKLYSVPLKCLQCHEVYGSVESTYPGHSSGICRKPECQHSHSEAMRAARERRGK